MQRVWGDRRPLPTTPSWTVTMLPINPAWLAAFDAELRCLFAIDHQDAGIDASVLGSYADLPPREAALAFGSDYDLERDDAVWPRSVDAQAVK